MKQETPSATMKYWWRSTSQPLDASRYKCLQTSMEIVLRWANGTAPSNGDIKKSWKNHPLQISAKTRGKNCGRRPEQLLWLLDMKEPELWSSYLITTPASSSSWK